MRRLRWWGLFLADVVATTVVVVPIAAVGYGVGAWVEDVTAAWRRPVR